jgi:tRNA(Phe) wybutosine-synthesizing methylase Tyw3
MYRSCVRLIYVLAKQTHSAELLINGLYTCYWQSYTVHSQSTVKICILICGTISIVALTTLKGMCLVYRSYVRLQYVLVKRTNSA